MPAPAIRNPHNFDAVKATHASEWRASCVHDSLIALNVVSMDGEEVLERLLSEAIGQMKGHADQYVTSPVKKMFDRYESLTLGGWWCSGLDSLQDFAPMEWGQFKADKPRIDPTKLKPIKYDAPPKVATGVYYLRISWFVGLTIATQHGYADEYKKRITSQDLNTEDTGFWPWALKTIPQVIITEGAKKTAALLTAGYLAVGLSGVSTGVKTRDSDGTRLIDSILNPYLEPIATPNRSIVICFDHDQSPTTFRMVNGQITNLWWALTKRKAVARIARLNSQEKGVDDFIAAHGLDRLAEVFAAARDLNVDRVATYRKINAPTSQTIDRRFLGDLEIPEDAKIVCIKSPKGTGKTEFLKSVVRAAQNSAYPLPVILISHRVQLAGPICDRIGIPYVSELRESAEGKLLGYGLCVDSLHPESQARFDAADYPDGAIVIFDESEQLIHHTLFATTEITRRRTEVLKQMEALLRQTYVSDRGKIFALDADLGGITIEFLKGMAGTTEQPHLIENIWQPDESEAWDVSRYDDHKPDVWLSELIDAIAGGQKPFIFTQSKRASSTYSTHNLELLFQARFPDRKILRIDQETVADPTHPAFGVVARLNEALPNYDIVLASPTIETGVSIDIRGHFTSVWCCFWGVSDSNSARQAAARVRESVPRHIWAAKRGVSEVARGETSLWKLLKDENTLADKGAELIRRACRTFSVEEGWTTNETAFNVWGKLACSTNIDLKDYREAIFSGLAMEGHVVNYFFGSKDKELIDELKEIKDEQKSLEARSIAEAETVNDRAGEALGKKKEKTKAEVYQEKKFKLRKRYGDLTEVTEDLVLKDADGWHPQLRLHYFLTLGNEFMSDRDAEIATHASASGSTWLPTLNKNLMSLRVMVLQKLGIMDLLTPDRSEQQYRGSDQDIIEIARMADQFRTDIKRVLNVTIPSDCAPIKAVNILLDRLGAKLTCYGRSGSRGMRERDYLLESLDDGRDDIFTQWANADRLKAESVSTTSKEEELGEFFYDEEAAA
jgi:hypothetical protein